MANALSRRMIHAAQIAPDALKIGISQGEVYLGSIGHPDYARPDVIGECVGLALLMRDWAAQHAKSGVAAQETVLSSCRKEFRGTIEAGKKAEAPKSRNQEFFPSCRRLKDWPSS